MKSEVFFVSASPTAREGKKDLAVAVKSALDGFLAKGLGKVVSLSVAADISSGINKALVTVIYDESTATPKK